MEKVSLQKIVDYVYPLLMFQRWMQQEEEEEEAEGGGGGQGAPS